MASDSNRAIARALSDTFKSRPTVMSYKDDLKKNVIYIATCVDSPSPGINSLSTLELSEYPLIKDGKEFPVRLEILFACVNNVDYLGNILATVAFFIMKDQWFCSPGVVYESIVQTYDPETKLPHLYFTEPFLWGDKPETMTFPDKKVAFLQAIMISESERLFLREHGRDAFEELIESKDVDICDLERDLVA